MSKERSTQPCTGSETLLIQEHCDAALRFFDSFSKGPKPFTERFIKEFICSLVDDETSSVHDEPTLVIDEEAHLTDAELRAVSDGQAFPACRRQVVLAHFVRGCASCRKVVENVELESFRSDDSLSKALVDWMQVARGIKETTDFMPAHGWTLARLTETFDGKDFARLYVESARSPKAHRDSLECLLEADEDLLTLSKADVGDFDIFRVLARAYAADISISSNVVEACMAGKAADALLAEAAIDDTDQVSEIRATVLEIHARQITVEKCDTALEKLRTAEGLLVDLEIPGRWLESKLRTSVILMAAGRLEDADVLLCEAREQLSPNVSKFLRDQLFHFLTYAESVAV